MRWAFPLAMVALALAGCGYVGAPLPPALNIPVKITDLRGVQRGDRILLAFTPPKDTTDKLILAKPPEIELRVGENPREKFEVHRWAADAKRIPVTAPKAEGVEMSIPSAEWAGREVIIMVRALGPTKKPSDWSSLLLLRVEPAPQAPRDLTVLNAGPGPYLEWKGDGTQWRVWRLDDGAKAPLTLGIAVERTWMDETAEIGKSYTYFVQQLVGNLEHPAESDMSPEVHMKHEDKFPPAVPAGLSAITGLKSVELSWDRSTEADFKGYQLYRAEGDGEMAKLGGLVDKPSFSDAQVVSGKKYKYAVAAVDESGNESQACAAVEVVAP